MSRRADVADAGRALGWLWSRSAAAAAVLLLAVSVPVASQGYGTPLVVAFLACTAQAAALPVALRHPGRATVLHAAGLLALAWTGDDSGPAGFAVVSLPGTAVVAVLLHVVVVGLLWPPRTAVVSAAVLVAAVLTAVGTSARATDGPVLTSAVDELLLYLVTLGLALLATIDQRRRSTTEAGAARARHEAALEADRRSLAQERARIARELHDVVAHSMSSIHLQASSAPYRLSGIDPATHAEFGEIAAGSREVMRDLGQLLRVLREGEQDAAAVPVPGLQQVAEEVASARAAGTPVDLVMDLDGAAPDSSPGLRVTVFRVVQEGLRNVQRHAPGARTTVTVVAEPRNCLTVSVRNGPPPPRPAPLEQEPGPLDDAGRSRLGLVGLEERARSLGGRLAHGSTDDGGHHVTAVLPCWGAARSARAALP